MALELLKDLNSSVLCDSGMSVPELRCWARKLVIKESGGISEKNPKN